jgi:hypothetical protein
VLFAESDGDDILLKRDRHSWGDGGGHGDLQCEVMVVVLVVVVVMTQPGSWNEDLLLVDKSQAAVAIRCQTVKS